MPRAQNAVAIVNAGFLFQMDNDLNTVLDARMVYGNINSQFTHAFATEQLWIGKKLFDDGNLQQAYRSLEQELKTDVNPPEAPPENRRQMAIALFYKVILLITLPYYGFLSSCLVCFSISTFNNGKHMVPKRWITT